MVLGPTLSTSLFINLLLAKVPLAITLSLPLRDPYELKSILSTPYDFKNLAAGESSDIFPAGEM